MPEDVIICSEKVRPRLGPDPTLLGFFWVNTIQVEIVSKGRLLKVYCPQRTHLNSVTIFKILCFTFLRASLK